MTPPFDEAKTTQVAGRLLKLRGTGKMHYLKLIKLMYLIDREALLRWGWSMTGDRYVSMRHGLVLSNTLDLITEESFGHSYWKDFISGPVGHYEVQLLKEPESDELSEADVALIDEIYGKFGHQNRWQLRDYTHTLPEFQDAEGSAIFVEYAAVMEGAQLGKEEIAEALSELHSQAVLDHLVS
jgi:hypothetical protein